LGVELDKALKVVE